MKLFPATETITFDAIDLLGELIQTRSGNSFLLVIKDLFTNLVRIIPPNKVQVTKVAREFVHNWVFVYGPPKEVLSEN